jgi:hypothetical protein
MELTMPRQRVRSRPGVFWTWWAAGTTSAAGSAVGAVALPLTALTVLDAGPFEMGLIAAAGYVAWLVIGLPAGVLVQRLPLRGAQIGADLARAVAVGSVPVGWWFGWLSVAQLIAVALVVSFANVVFDVANATFLPEIVEREQLQARNSLTSATHAATQLGGPSAGGFCVQLLGPVVTVLVDAASYLVSAALLRTLPARGGGVRGGGGGPTWGLIREGWWFVVRHPVMGPGMWTATAVNFVCGAQLAVYPLYLVRELHAPAALVGLLLAGRLARRCRADAEDHPAARVGAGAGRGRVRHGRRGGAHPGRDRLDGVRRVRRRQRRVRRWGGRAERDDQDLSADRQPAGAPVAGDGHGQVRVVGRDPHRGPCRGCARRAARRAGDALAVRRGRARRARGPGAVTGPATAGADGFRARWTYSRRR